AGLSSKLSAIQKLTGVTEKEAKKIVYEIRAETLEMDYPEQERISAENELGDEE
ncbi:poly(3-hydroxybutyrate) depolymerase, partial [Enterococcus faecalis]|nr:poly(3-hydroxybutyrate) depolymerase [Enterococcus faecalis]